MIGVLLYFAVGALVVRTVRWAGNDTRDDALAVICWPMYLLICAVEGSDK